MRHVLYHASFPLPVIRSEVFPMCHGVPKGRADRQGLRPGHDEAGKFPDKDTFSFALKFQVERSSDHQCFCVGPKRKIKNIYYSHLTFLIRRAIYSPIAQSILSIKHPPCNTDAFIIEVLYPNSAYQGQWNPEDSARVGLHNGYLPEATYQRLYTL